MSPRDEILKWTEGGQLKPEEASRAFAIAGVTPQLSDWRTFVNTFLLWTGSILVAAGVIFFFAYNWKSLPRFGKFALGETVFAVAVIAAWLFGIQRAAGKAAILGAALLTGALLALLGQTYQTGADTFELFAYWALLILPWVIVARFAPLWLLWIGLLNLSVGAYFQALRWGLFGFLFGTGGMLWALFALNVVALAGWEFGLGRGLTWLNRWGARIVGFLLGCYATIIAVICLVDPREIGAAAILVYLAWLGVMYAYYRMCVFDVFMLAGTMLSAIVVITVFLGRHLLAHGDSAGGFLLIALVIIGMSGAGAWWIREMLRTQTAEAH
jgi:uncharacterized membrane protein